MDIQEQIKHNVTPRLQNLGDMDAEKIVNDAIQMIVRENNGEDPTEEQVINHLPNSMWWFYENEWEDKYLKDA